MLVAGTNGKGSTAATLVGDRGGRRTAGGSLHVAAPRSASRERIRDRRRTDVSDEELDAALARVFAAADARAGGSADLLRGADRGGVRRPSPSARLDLAILEVGLGGRFDATNVAPAASLGRHVDRARPHRGAGPDARRDRPGEGRHLPRAAGRRSIGPRRTKRARASRERGRATRRGPPRRRPTRSRVARGHDVARGHALSISRRRGGRYELATPLPGAHQAGNAALAVRAAELLPERCRGRRRRRSRAGVAADALARAPRALRRPRRAPSSSTAATTRRARRRSRRFLADAGLAGRATSSSARWRTRTSRGWPAILFPRSRRVTLVAGVLAARGLGGGACSGASARRARTRLAAPERRERRSQSSSRGPATPPL